MKDYYECVRCLQIIPEEKITRIHHNIVVTYVCEDCLEADKDDKN